MLLDVSDRLVVIIGGGGVASRKATGLIEAGAKRVRAVSPTFVPQMPSGVERVEARYEPRHLDGAALVFAATDSAEVNETVVKECRARGVWVNRADADEDQPADFSTPARWKEGNLLLTVSTGGSPALAAAVRDWVAEHLPKGLVRMAGAMELIRPTVLNSGLSIEERRTIFRALATPEAVEALETEGMDGLVRWLGRRWPGVGQQTKEDRG